MDLVLWWFICFPLLFSLLPYAIINFLFLSYRALPKVNEKKQVFNTYKQQKSNEEKDQEREKAKENREKLQIYLEEHPRMHSHVRYRKACEMFESDKVWNSVVERDRKDLFDDVLFFLAKKEKEDEKKLHMYNKQYMMETFAKMEGLSCRTLWSEVLSFFVFFWKYYLQILS